MKIYWIHEKLYGCNLGIIIGDYERCKRYLEKRHSIIFENGSDDKPKATMCVRWITLKSNNRKVYYIWMPNWEYDREHLSDLAHEIGHIAIFVFNEIDTDIDYKTCEPFLYLVRFLYSEILKITEYIIDNIDYKTCKPAMEYMKEMANAKD